MLRPSVNFLRFALLTGTSAAAILSPGLAQADMFARRTADPTQQAVRAAAEQAARQAGTSEASRRALQSLNRVEGLRRSLEAARAAAQAAGGAIPNGLKIGGLEVARALAGDPALWTGANAPTETVGSDGKTLVTIKQNERKAILTWDRFNVGLDTTLYFDQRAGGAAANEWIALNRVSDAYADPSRILGQIKAEGQVYLLNRNGIIFGGASQVNVHGILAATMSMTNEQFRNGLLYKADITHPALVGTPGDTKDVVVEAGAKITVTELGKIILAGGNVVNAGELTAKKGQVILAAGDAVYFDPNTAPESGGVRGLVVNVGNSIGAIVDRHPDPQNGNRTILRQAKGSGGTAINKGLVTSAQGDITLVGQHVTQGGVLLATTSATMNGSIKLWARSDQLYLSNERNYNGVFGGELTLSPDSLTAILADSEAKDSLLDRSAFQKSLVHLVGSNISVGRGASIIAPGGNVSFLAGDIAVPVAPDPVLQNLLQTNWSDRLDDGSRIFFDQGSLVNVDGLNGVSVAMERNSVRVELRGDELADFPHLRDGPMRGRTIFVDRRKSGVRDDGTTWVGTPYGNVSAWFDLLPYETDELLTDAGSIRVEARGDIIAKQDSILSAVGGSVRFKDGIVRTSKVIWRGKVYDISELTPEMTDAVPYDGTVVHHTRWGIREIFTSPFGFIGFGRMEKGYAEGRDGGKIHLTAHHMSLAGKVDVSAGVGDVAREGSRVAYGGSLQFGEGLRHSGGPQRDRTLPDVRITTTAPVVGSDFAEDDLLPEDLDKTIYLSTDLLNNSGAKDLTILSNQTVTLEDGANLVLAPGGSFDVTAAQITIDGTVRAPAGRVSLLATPGASPTGAGNHSDTSYLDTENKVTLGAKGKIDVSGLWVNLFTDPDQQYHKPWLNGGSVTIEAHRFPHATNINGGIFLEKGSLIDVSSGGLLQRDATHATDKNDIPLGDAGAISVVDGSPEFLNTEAPQKYAPSRIDSEFRGYGLGRGGSLSISSASMQIGGTLEAAEPLSSTDAAATPEQTLLLDEEFFTKGGFANYRLIGWRGVTVADGTKINLETTSYLLGHGASLPASGAALADFAGYGQRLPHLRDGGTLSLWSPYGDVTLGKGTEITGEVGLNVDVRAARNLSVYGSIIATGGNIVLANDLASRIALNLDHRYATDDMSVYVADSARLIANGTVHTWADPRTGLRSAKLFDGGSVEIAGRNVIVNSGAVVDVSGAKGVIDIVMPGATQAKVREQNVATSAGSVLVKTYNYLFFDPTIMAHPGDTGMAGGSFTFSNLDDRNYNDPLLPYAFGGKAKVRSLDPIFYPGPLHGNRILLRDKPAEDEVIPELGSVIPTMPTYNLFTRTFDQAGFDRISLNAYGGTISFAGDTLLTARSSVTLGAAIFGAADDAAVHIKAPYVSLQGQNSLGETAVPADGAATLTIEAELIDISGRLALGLDVENSRTASDFYVRYSDEGGFSEVLFKSSGDIRLFGLNQPGMLNLYRKAVFEASRIYPVSGNSFIINGFAVQRGLQYTILNPDSVVEIRHNGKNAGVPLSAGGKLIIAAPHIVQGGVLRAPAGSIVLTNNVSHPDILPSVYSRLQPYEGGDIILKAGSLTSVDLEGMKIPFGVVTNETDWGYLNQRTPSVKEVSLEGQAISVEEGAVVSASGGGDLLAYEFVPGPGGSRDVLHGGNVFAVVPSYDGPLPSDASWGADTSLKVGDRVYLSDIPGLKAGYYTLLPGHYALLPGGYRVVIDKANSNIGPEFNNRTANGSYKTAGYLVDGFSGARSSSKWSTFLVTSGDAVRKLSQFKEYDLSAFLLKRAITDSVVAPRLPIEPGRIRLDASKSLDFEGALRTTPVEGLRGGQIDISSSGDILIGNAQTAPIGGTLVLRAEQLSQLETESLMIGGVRQGTSQDGLNTVLDGSSLTVKANRVMVDTQGVVLSTNELILVGKNGVDVNSGSVLEATGSSTSAGSSDLYFDQGRNVTGSPLLPEHRVNNGSAVLVVSNREAPNITRGTALSGPLPAIGNIEIGEGARISASRSVVVDGANVEIDFGPGSLLQAKQVEIAALHISLGQVENATTLPGLVLNTAAVAQLSKIEDLTLRSSETIDFYGGFTLGGNSAGSRITLDAQGLVGTANDGQAVTLNAGEVQFVNSKGIVGTPPQPAAGAGTLAVNAERILMGGNMFLDGMVSTLLVATTEIGSIAAPKKAGVTNTSSGMFDIRQGDVTIQAGRVTTAPRVDRTLRVTNGNLVIASVSGRPSGNHSGGGSLRLEAAGDIRHGGLIDLVGGSVVLKAGGDLELLSGSSILAKGFAKQFFDVTRVAPAGTVDLISGDALRIAEGAIIDVSSPGDAGKIGIVAGSGQAVLDGTFLGAGGADYRSGSFSLEAQQVADLNTLAARLSQSGFNREQTYHLHTGEVVLTSPIRAQHFALTTDTGSILVHGVLDASGQMPGSIRLSAGQNVMLANGAVLNVSSSMADSAGKGGTVLLETLGGVIDMQRGSRIELAAGGESRGTLTLRVPRLGNDIGTGHQLLSGINGAGAIYIDAFRVYDNIDAVASSGSGGSTLTWADIHADNQAFISASGAAIRARLLANLAGVAADTLHVRPEAEVRSAGNLTVTNDDRVNLADYRYDGDGGVLTLKAAGDLVVNGNISDAFSTADADTGILLSAAQGNGQSWNYRFVAGSALDSADVRATAVGGHFTLEVGRLIRTGTGDIEVYAGGDIHFAAWNSVLYTAGVAQEVYSLNVPVSARYGLGGGNIRMEAGGNISNGTPTSAGGSYDTRPSEQLVNSWLYRQGDKDVFGNVIAGAATTWWVDHSQFQQGGVGALGGGNIVIRAGDAWSSESGDVTNLSAVLPTTGIIQDGKQHFAGGGGDLLIEARRDIKSGLYYVGRGDGYLRAGRNIGSGRTVGDTVSGSYVSRSDKAIAIYPILALGDARLNLYAGADATIHTIFNPTVTFQAARNADGDLTPWSTFFTYGKDAAVNIVAVGGNTAVNLDITALYKSLLGDYFRWAMPGEYEGSRELLMPAKMAQYTGQGGPSDDVPHNVRPEYLYPWTIAAPTLKMTTFTGDIALPNGLTLYPSSTGTLELLSARGIYEPRTQKIDGLRVSDTDPNILANPFNVQHNFAEAYKRLWDRPTTSYRNESGIDQSRLHAALPLHLNDYSPVLIYAADGDVDLNYDRSRGYSNIAGGIISAKPVWMRASRDIRDIMVLAQNNNATDLSLFSAGRDIRFSSSPDGRGTSQITVAGPGRLEVEAGRDIELGNSVIGITTIGNLRNPALASSGASIAITAGAQDTRYVEFADAYIAPGKANEDTIKRLKAFAKERNGGKDVSAEEAWALFNALTVDERKVLIRDVFHAELAASATEATKSDPQKAESYARGFKAIETLFPGKREGGNIRMISSQVITYDGGNIDLVAPGGAVTLGVIQPTEKNQQGASVITQRGGNIRSFSYGDILVNQAALQTLDGGDIALWSSTGNIDAGKGAKTRRRIARPGFRTTSDGTTLFDPASTSTGAGIATLRAVEGAAPGNILLVTPNGYVDAGDAGIRSSGNITVAALLGVLNADNIQVTGQAIGVPDMAQVNVGALTSASNAVGAVTKMAEQATRQPAEQPVRTIPPVITARFLGFGEQ